MARTQNPLIGASSGSIGGVTLYSSGGQYLARTKPLQVGNPRTNAQVKQRNKFRKLVDIGRQMTNILDIGFAGRPQKRSGYNQFVSVNKDAFTVGTATDADLVPANIVLAQGNLHKPEAGAAPSNTGATLTVNWGTGTGLNGSDDDKILCVVMDELGELVLGIEDDFARVDGTGTVTVSPYTTGADINIFLFAYNPVTKQASDSVHIADTLA